MPKITRRETLARGGQAVAAAAMTEDPFEALAKEWTACKAVCEPIYHLPPESEAPLKTVTEAAFERKQDIEKRIAETPATTLFGVVTKLRYVNETEDGYVFYTSESTIKTALAGAERLLEQSQEADADLLRLGDEHKTYLDELHAGKHRDAEGDILDEATEHLDALAAKIAATPANTFAGLAVKLRIGTDNQRFKTDLDFQVEDLTPDELSLMNALADAERLAGEAS